VAALFLRLGATSFGGPAAHVALMEEEVVRRRGWLTRDEFLDLLGAANLIPGPNSTELALHIGAKVAGWRGLLAAGGGFVLPAVLITAAVAWAYVEYGTRPAVAGVLAGVQPVVLALIARAGWGLGRSAVKSGKLAALGVGCAAAALLGVHELVVLLAAGLAAVLAARPRGALAVAPVLPVFAASTQPVGLGPLFLAFLKVGGLLFGSGYVLIAFLRADFVDRNGWLTEQQLLDAVAVGQVTPGPVFSTATFVGYVLAGPEGAVVATVGIFLPAFVLVAATKPLVPRLRRSAAAGAFLDGVNVASLALMAVAAGQIGWAVRSWPAAAGFAVCLVVLLRTRLNPTWLILAGAAVGLAVGSAGQ
jgi:chromate transporter